MKILYYTDVFSPIIVSYATNLAGGLANAASKELAEVTVVTRTPACGFDDFALPYRVVRRPGALRLWRLISRSEVVQLAGPCLLPLLLCWLQRKPTVIEHHGYQAACPNGLFLYHPTCSPCPGHFVARRYHDCVRCNAQIRGLTGSLIWLLLTFPRSWLSKRIQSNVCITHHVERRLELPRSRVIYYGIKDLGPFTSCAKPAINGEQKIVAYVGRLVAEKGLTLLLRAANQLKNSGYLFRVKFIGDGPERTNLQGEATVLGLQGIAVFTGELRGDALREALDDVSAVVMPSVWEETAGLAAIEHMMRGRPVIVSDIGGLGEVVDGTGLKFAPGDVNGLAYCLRSLLDSPDALKPLGEKARQRALELFSHDRMMTEHVDLYRELVSSSRPPRVKGGATTP